MQYVIHWLRSWRVFLGMSLVLVFWLIWAWNIKTMWSGEPVRGTVHYGYHLFSYTPIIAGIAAGSALVLLTIALISWDDPLPIPQIAVWLAGYASGVAAILGIATLIGHPFITDLSFYRVSHETHRYLLQGTSGGSGNIFYRVFTCDQQELVCTQLSTTILISLGTPPPTLVYDSPAHELIVREADAILGHIPLLP